MDGREELVFAPLGGVGEIGMNLSIYGLGSERKKTWMMWDRPAYYEFLPQAARELAAELRRRDGISQAQ